MHSVNTSTVSQRSSFSSMDGKWSVPQLLRTIERLKSNHYQNFIEEVADDDDEEFTTKIGCKVLFCTLIESYSIISTMYDSVESDHEHYAAKLCQLTPSTLRDRVFESMENKFA